MATKTIQSIRDSLECGISTDDLTERQSEVLTYILQCWMSGYIPTYREVSDVFEFSSPNAAVTHTRALEHKGYLEAAEGKSSLWLTDKALELIL